MVDGGWKHSDVDNMDVVHFLEIMDDNNSKSNSKNGSKHKKVRTKEEIEDWYKSI